MNDIQLRSQALELAMRYHDPRGGTGESATVLETAERFYAFMRGDRLVDRKELMADIEPSSERFANNFLRA